jgi:hypothetical protein
VSVAGESALVSAECAPNSPCPDCFPAPPPGIVPACLSGQCDLDVIGGI